MNKENLIKMAEHIATIPQHTFSMTYYRKLYDGDRISPKCDSIGCVIGHCTILDAENVSKHYMSMDGMSINFATWAMDFVGITHNNPIWFWCFGSAWSVIDNTPEGASKRIMYLVNNGEVPLNWKEQMSGIAPLCYK